MKQKFLLLILFMMPALISYAQQVIILTDSTEVPELNLEEIKISASKSNLTLKKMPGTVTMFTSKSISENEVQSLNDLTALTPGLFMPDYGSRLTSPVYIRGIGSRINSPSVGLYVDNVPYFEKAAYDFDFFDVERIEILKGPQGTLYGRNAMGGIINVITRSPIDYQGNRIAVTTGNYGHYSANIGHYNKIGDNFAYALSANYLHRDGYYTNDFLDKQIDNANSYGLRNRLVWQKGDKFSIENILSYERSEEGGYPYALLDDSLQTPHKISYNQPSSYNRSILSDAVVIKYNAGNFEVQSTTAYQYLDDQQNIDQDFTPDSLYYVVQEQRQNMVSQELIVRSNHEKKINWLFGAYGFMQRFDKGVDVDIFSSNMTVLKQYDKMIAGAALFHQLTVNDFFIEDLSLTAGIRLDYETNVLDYVYDFRIAGNTTHVADTVYPDLTYTELLPKLALNYKFARSSLYGVIAKGYKTGGFNSTFYKEEDLFFNPEYSWSYEVGLKSVLYNSNLYTDVSLFYIDWRNQQIYQPAFYKDDSPAPGSLLKNAGKSSSTGLELSVKSAPVFGFTPALSYGFTHAVFTEHMVDDATDYSGNYLPYMPRHTLNISMKKDFRIHQTGLLDKISLNLMYSGLGDVYWNEENSYKTDYYNVLNAKISFVKNAFRFEIFGKNLLNADYDVFYFEAIGNQYVQRSKPVRAGLNIKYEF